MSWPSFEKHFARIEIHFAQGRLRHRAASLTDDPALRDYLFKRATGGLG